MYSPINRYLRKMLFLIEKTQKETLKSALFCYFAFLLHLLQIQTCFFNLYIVYLHINYVNTKAR